MSLRSIFCCCLVVVSLQAVTVPAQEERSTAGKDSVGQQYLSAQRAQRNSDLPGAVAGYTSFLVQAQVELEEAYLLGGDAARSMQLLDNVLELSRTPEVLLQGARASLLAGKLDRAKALATELVATRPSSTAMLAGAHEILGRVMLKAQQPKEARQEFELATALDPTFQNGYDLIVACLEIADEACANRVSGEMERSFGDKPELHIALGKAYGNSDFQARALEEFRRAIAEDPRLRGAHYLLAAVLLANGGDESARVDAEQELLVELRLSPQDTATYAALGQIALIQNNYAKAEDLLRKAIEYGPEWPEAYLYLGQVYFNTGRSKEAESAMRSCIQRTADPSRGRYQVQKAHYLLGRILSQRGQQDQARAELQLSRELANKALNLDKTRLAGSMESAHAIPIQVELTESAGAIQTRDANAIGEAASLEAELRPALADAYDNLGVLAATSSHYQEASADFRHAFAWDPQLKDLDYNWGRSAFASGSYAEAIAPLTRYVAAHANDAGARSVLAISLFQVGKYASCVEALTPFEGRTPLAPQVELLYAQALVKTGRVDEGAAKLSALAKANPNYSEIQSALAEVRSLKHGAHN